MARKHRGHGMSSWRRSTKKILGLVGTGVGIAVVSSPAITSIDVSNPGNIPKNMLYNYTGYSLDSQSWNAQQAGVGVASVLGGILLIKAFRWVARQV